MRIVQIISSISKEATGPSYSVPRLSEALAAKGNHVEIATVDNVEGCEISNGVTLRRFSRSLSSLPVLRQLQASRSMQKWLNERGVDGSIFHVHGLWLMSNVYPGMIAKRYGVPLIHAPRGMLAPEALAFSPLKKRLFATFLQNRALTAAACLHATSDKEFEDIRSFDIKAPVAMIPNGIDVPSGSIGLSTFHGPNRNGREYRCRKVVFVGRLHRIKGLNNLLGAWNQVCREFSDWELNIIGPSENGHGDELRAEMQRLCLPRVTIGGTVYGDEKNRTYREADLFVLPTVSENFGMVVAESLANGTPVICTKGAPWKGLVENRCGWWIDHGSDALASALRQAMSCSPQKREEMGLRGRAWMERDFSWDRIAAEMSEVYRWMLQGGDPPDTVRFN